MEPFQTENVTAKKTRKLRSFVPCTAEKVILQDRGWTYRTAAAQLDVTYSYLSNVLNGKFKSRRLLEAVRNLPVATVPRKRKPSRKTSLTTTRRTKWTQSN